MHPIEEIIRNRTQTPPVDAPHIVKHLSPSQQLTLSASYYILNNHRAVLLHEETGSGKTYVAAALAALYASTNNHPCFIVAPAHLLHNWENVLALFNVNANLFSYQDASLHNIPAPPHNDTLWIIDEAHLLKNMSTKRYIEIKKLTSCHKICLISATPISLGWKDLYALSILSGFPTDPICAQKEWIHNFAFCISPQSIVPKLSINAHFVQHHITLSFHIALNQNILNSLCNVLSNIHWPSIFPNGSLKNVPLLHHVLMHRLISHKYTCRITLKKLFNYYNNCSLNSASCILSRKEFHSLIGECPQRLLPFPDWNFNSINNLNDKRSLENTLSNINSALKLLNTLCNEPDLKLLVIQNYIHTLPKTSKLIIFTQYADSAEYIYNNLIHSGSIALLTANKSSLNHYHISPDLLYDMFDPNLNLPDWWKNTNTPPASILICSDAFACGQNFQNANVLIHFDTPWNPTTLIQREGRILRKGQSAQSVSIVHLTSNDVVKPIHDWQSHLLNQMSLRQNIQNAWKYAQPPLLHPKQLLFINAPNIPPLWAKCMHTWIPVSPALYLNIPQNASITNTTLLNAFSMNISKHKHFFAKFWTALKHSHLPSASQSLRSFLIYCTTSAIFPQCANSIFIDNNITFSSSSLTHLNFPSLPQSLTFSVSTPCQIISLYPQLSTPFPQLIHNLSTA